MRAIISIDSENIFYYSKVRFESFVCTNPYEIRFAAFVHYPSMSLFRKLV